MTIARNLKNRSHQNLLNDDIEEEEEEEEEEEQVRLVGTPPPSFLRMPTNGPSTSGCQGPRYNYDHHSEFVNTSRPVFNNAMLYSDYSEYNGTEAVHRSSFGTWFDCFKTKWNNYKCNPLVWLTTLFPILVWLPAYKWKKYVTFDLVAGFTVAVMHIPQGMAYAQLASLPPIVGIYMGFFPVIMYSLVGTSRHISMGTFAVVCLMTGKVALEKIGDYTFVSSASNSTDSIGFSFQRDFQNSFYKPEFNIVQIATAISFSVGIWQVAMGFLRLGSLSLLLSAELVSGFTTGAAVHVLTSQLKSLLGLSVPKRNGILKIPLMWIDVFENIKKVNFMALGLSSVTLISLMVYSEILKPRVCDKFKLPIPVELITVVLGTLISYAFNLSQTYGIEIVNDIPTGFPAPMLPPMKVVPDVIFDSLIIAIVAYVISVSMAKAFGAKHNYAVEPNQELFANGTSNLVGSCFSCAPISASLSRSMIQDQVGGKTQLAGLFSCGVLVFVLLWLGPYFETLPSCILSSMIIVAMKSMLSQVTDFPKAWRESLMNGSVWLATFVSTVLLDIEYGLGVGLAMSVALLVLRSNKPQLFVVGSYNHSDIYVDVEKSDLAKEIPGLRIIKCTGSLNFATIEKFLEKFKILVPLPPRDNRSKVFGNGVIGRSTKSPIEDDDSCNLCILSKDERPKPEHWTILDFSSVSAIDPAAVKALVRTNGIYSGRRLQILLSGCCDPVLDLMNSCGLISEIGANNFFPLLHDAVIHAKSLMASLPENLSQSYKQDDLALSLDNKIITVSLGDIDYIDPMED